jgi:hypothetical protein
VKVSFNKNIEFEKQCVCVGKDNVYFNYTTEKKKLINDFIPWRSAREKNPILIQMFIEAFCKPGAVVIDVIASTGVFVIFMPTINIQLVCFDVSIDFLPFFVMLIKYILIICFLNLFSGASVHTCRKSGHHLVAYETDDLIFNNILQPLRELSSQKPVLGQSLQPPSLEDDDGPPCKVARKLRLST